MGDTRIKSCLSTSGSKRGSILRLALSENSTSRWLCYQWMGWWGRIERCKLSNFLPPCKKNRTWNTWKHVGMYRPVSTWTLCVPLSYWCEVHGVVYTGEQDKFPQTDKNHQYWRRREFRYLDREQRRCICRECSQLAGIDMKYWFITLFSPW